MKKTDAVELKTHKSISKYSLVNKIGRGSTADVWSAVDQDDLHVALKIYSKIKHLDKIAYQLFKDEFEKTKLLRHPNVLSAQEFIIEDETPILSFPLYESCLEKEIIRRKIEYLEKNIDNPSFFSNEDIFDIVRQVAEGLAYLHENNIIHNDIKPANIVFRKTDEGQVQCSIIDFGISLNLKNYTKNAYHKEIASSKTVVYAAPEKLNGVNTEPKSDIFSLGMVIYELAGGKNKSITAGDIVVKGGHIILENRATKDPIQMLISACLKKDPQMRPDAKTLSYMIVSFQKSNNTKYLKYPKKSIFDFIKSKYNHLLKIFKNS